MKQVLFGAALVALAAAPAFAQPALNAPYDWHGLYFGAHAGIAWSNPWTGKDINSAAAPFQWDMSPNQTSAKHSILGGQIGFNYQIQRFVLGIEADISSTGLKGNGRITPIPTSLVPGGVPGSFAFMSRKIDLTETLRARIGYAFDRLLIYATGGVAFAHIKYTADTNFVAAGGFNYPVSSGMTKTGNVFGAGLEYALPSNWGNWTARGEYLHYSFGAQDFTGTHPATATLALYHWGPTQFHVARIGLNYKFGGW